ncbi:VOC family protein [Nonomuraea sp. SBT364]|uniref:VOC family protein n=1 Tax=Nonomuraea sp. SBT364 TaxID=1580530 RepID=UPI00066DC07C|nr:VOC family protein [Nonomuraea sp. SBT364]
MTAHVIPTLLGVRDLEAAKRFYTDGLGWKIKNDHGISVFFEAGGASSIGLYGREGLAKLVGTSPEGGGFSGVVLTCEVSSEARVDKVMAEAEEAGATILKAPAALPWGGYGGTFADPDGYVWRVGHSAQGEDQSSSE